MDEYQQVPPPAKVIQPITGECNLSTETLPPNFKQQGSDWSVVLNPSSQAISESPIKLDLVHSFDHSSVVCCVKFSKCGNFLATGCNHVATVYDVRSGEKIA